MSESITKEKYAERLTNILLEGGYWAMYDYVLDNLSENNYIDDIDVDFTSTDKVYNTIIKNKTDNYIIDDNLIYKVIYIDNVSNKIYLTHFIKGDLTLDLKSTLYNIVSSRIYLTKLHDIIPISFKVGAEVEFNSINYVIQSLLLDYNRIELLFNGVIENCNLYNVICGYYYWKKNKKWKQQA